MSALECDRTKLIAPVLTLTSLTHCEFAENRNFFFLRGCTQTKPLLFCGVKKFYVLRFSPNLQHAFERSRLTGVNLVSVFHPSKPRSEAPIYSMLHSTKYTGLEPYTRFH